jgi:hypothetical protein
MRLLAALVAAALGLLVVAATAGAQAPLVDLGPLGKSMLVSNNDDDGGDDDDAPRAETRPATEVGLQSATLNGKVNPNDRDTTYHFQYGTTTAYGTKTAVTSAGDEESWIAVSARVVGLQPETTYHFRLVAKSDEGTTGGADLTFTTGAAPVTPVDTPPGGDTSPPGDGSPANPGSPVNPGRPANPGSPGDDTPGEPGGGFADDPPTVGVDVPAPELGTQVGAAPESGTVLVMEKGSDAFAPLDADAGLPVGSVVDARDGAVKLTTRLASGGTQSGTFWGAVFQVRQRRSEGGLTELILRGPKMDCGPRTSRAAKARPHRRRGLWGRDSKGRWRTRGRGSQATTRGTRWYTEERCDGTFTKVSEGAVEVRDFRRKRTVIVKAGHSYLAGPRSQRR